MIAGQVIEQVKQRLDKAASCVVVVGAPAQFDEVAAALGLRLGLSSLGKRVEVVCEAPMVAGFGQLVGVDKVKKELGGKSMMIVFGREASEKVERVSYEMDEKTGKLKLVVYAKEGRELPSEADVEFETGGAEGDAMFLLGERWGKLEEEISGRGKEDLIWVGMAGQKVNLPVGMMVQDGAAAASEVVAGLLSALGVKWDEDLATNLFLGVEAGSRGFTGRGVKAETFRLVADLMEAGARRSGREEQVASGGQGDWMTPKVYKGGMLV